MFDYCCLSCILVCLLFSSGWVLVFCKFICFDFLGLFSMVTLRVCMYLCFRLLYLVGYVCGVLFDCFVRLLFVLFLLFFFTCCCLFCLLLVLIVGISLCLRFSVVFVLLCWYCVIVALCCLICL